MQETFGQQLQRFRIRTGFTTLELAGHSQIDRKTLTAWQKDRRVPRDIKSLQQLAEALKLAPEEQQQLYAAAARQRSSRGSTSRSIELSRRVPIVEELSISPMLHQLRTAVTDFVGRSEEADHLIAALQATGKRGGIAAISGIQGMGGIGKTELAYLVANHLVHQFPDAQIVIDLQGSQPAPLTSEQVLQTVIRVFDRQAKLPDTRHSLETYYRSLLHGRHVLILADDVRDAAQVRPLLPPPGCALLITSRQRFVLPGMTTVNLDQLNDHEAIELLRTICSRISHSEAAMIAHVCGNLPLALRVSASILVNDPALSVPLYCQRLTHEQHRLKHLRDPDDSHLNVEASLSLSYLLLDTYTRYIFCQLGLFVAPFTTSMAQAVVRSAHDMGIEGVLHLLLRRNMLMYDESRGRWWMHELMRTVALNHLAKISQVDDIWKRYAVYTLQVAYRSQEQFLAGGTNIAIGLEHFDAERPHISAVKHWLFSQAQTSEVDQLILEYALATASIGDLRFDQANERIPEFKRALLVARRLSSWHTEATILNTLGKAHADIGDVQRAVDYFQELLLAARQQQDEYYEALALSNLGNGYKDLGRIKQAIEHFEQSFALAHKMGNQHRQAIALGNLAGAYRAQGNTHRAIEYYEQRLMFAQTMGDRRGEGIARGNLGGSYIELGDGARARSYLEQAREIFRELGDRRGEGLTLSNLGRAFLVLNNVQQSIETSNESLSIVREVGDTRLEAYSLCNLGRAYATIGRTEEGHTHFEQALVLFKHIRDRDGMTECCWYYGLALMDQGSYDRALPLLQIRVTYEQEVEHLDLQAHTVLIARVEQHLASDSTG